MQLCAAPILLQDSLRVLVLEADDHIGGRCVTDAAALSVPFDRGGSWLHAAPINPLARIAEARGESLHKTEWRWRWVQSGERALSGAELAAYNRYQAEIWTAVNAAGAGPKDLRIKDVLPPSPHRETAQHWVAQMLGADAELTSVADVRQYADADGDWLIEGGFGAFVARLHADVPVRLNCPVSRIDYSGPGVRAATPDGVVTAERLVLTVSTGVLAAPWEHIVGCGSRH